MSETKEANENQLVWFVRGHKVIFSNWFSKADNEEFVKVIVLDKKNLPVLSVDYTKVIPCQGIAEEYAECVDIMQFAGLYG